MKYFLGMVMGFAMVAEVAMSASQQVVNSVTNILLGNVALAGILIMVINVAYAINSDYEQRIRDSERERMAKT